MTPRSALIFSPGAAGPLIGGDGLSWQDRGLCAETFPDAFFPEKGEPSAPAKKVCRSCPVIAECLEYALANDERFGIWGGTSERDRRKIKCRAAREALGEAA